MTVCKRVLYSGQVQGVGFRYTARGLSAGFDVAGYVRNLANGDVELVAEGREDQVQAFLAALAKQMAAGIERSTVEDLAPTGQTGFRVRH